MSAADQGGPRDYDFVRLQHPEPAIARIVLDRPEKRNAQNLALLYELNDAFDRAAIDEDVTVIVLAATGSCFSAGHDLVERAILRPELFEGRTVGSGGNLRASGVHGMFAREDELYFGLYQRWRNLAKPTIAQVHGDVVAAGLMLAWACDLIIASEDTTFCDPVVGVGVPGVEVFNHPWELGARKAKEFLFTADKWTAQEAHRLGMVNHVVAGEELDGFTLDLARRIAARPRFALALAKEAVNQSLDIQGQSQALRSAFYLHHLGQGQAVRSDGMDLTGLPDGLRDRWAKWTGEPAPPP
ncbi:MAG TPA: enoyl-CoA hydratase [Acidimicrobiia bacterium]|nr:enoyl-CoA hydratase [Acidimicrobiia bacterium]